MCELLVYIQDQIARKTLQRVLKRGELQPIFINDTDELEEKLRFGAGDIIVIDILDFSSITTIRRQLADFFEIVGETQVILLTPYGVGEKELQPFAEQGCHFLEKPISPSELVDLIHNLTKH